MRQEMNVAAIPVQTTMQRAWEGGETESEATPRYTSEEYHQFGHYGLLRDVTPPEALDHLHLPFQPTLPSGQPPLPLARLPLQPALYARRQMTEGG